MLDSNQRPPACEAGALPTELIDRDVNLPTDGAPVNRPVRHAPGRLDSYGSRKWRPRATGFAQALDDLSPAGQGAEHEPDLPPRSSPPLAASVKRNAQGDETLVQVARCPARCPVGVTAWNYGSGAVGVVVEELTTTVGSDGRRATVRRA
jgi:hypothetical protein